MRLGFSAWAMPTMPVAEQIDLVARAGYSAIELVGADDAALNPLTISDGGVREVRQRLDDARLALPSIACHGNLLFTDPALRAREAARVIAAMELAARLADSAGPPCVVTMAWGEPHEYEARRQQIADNFAELAIVGARLGVVVAIEPHVGQALDLPERVQWVLDAVGSPWVRLNFDNSHFEVMGCDPAAYVPRLAPYAVHTHMKDQRGIAPNYEFLVPGEGEFDYASYLSRLDAVGYVGAVTVEISKMVQNRPQYDPVDVVHRSYRTLTVAAQVAGIRFAEVGSGTTGERVGAA